MRWHLEPWRKLYTRITADWLQLSVMARGIADELLKYVKDDGFLCRTRGAEPALSVALILTPRPDEMAAVQDAAAELIGDGYLEVRDDEVHIRNFEAAQDRSPAAIRQARYRERKSSNQADSERNALRDKESRVLRRSDPIRDDTKRDEDKSPPAQSADPAKAKPRRERKETPARPGWSEIVASYSDAWKSLHSTDGSGPEIDGADISGLARVYDKHGIENTKALIQRFVSDDDPFVARRGWLLRDLPSRVNAYRAKPIQAKAANVGYARPGSHNAIGGDSTDEL